MKQCNCNVMRMDEWTSSFDSIFASSIQILHKLSDTKFAHSKQANAMNGWEGGKWSHICHFVCNVNGPFLCSNRFFPSRQQPSAVASANSLVAAGGVPPRLLVPAGYSPAGLRFAQRFRCCNAPKKGKSGHSANFSI